MMRQAMLRIEIHFKGCINPLWSEWFAGLTSEPSGPDETVLFGQIADQAALYGLIARLRDLGLRLVSVHCEEMVIRTKPP
jgi:hypothetical protein